MGIPSVSYLLSLAPPAPGASPEDAKRAMLMQVGIAEVFGAGDDFAAGLSLGNCLGAGLGGGLAGRFGCDFAHDLGSGALRVLGHADFL
jgi:hypothetical protein